MSLLQKKLLLIAVSLLLITGFFLLPKNQWWLQTRIAEYYSEIPYQVRHLDIEKRKVRRWGNDYVYSKQIASYFESKDIKTKVLVLVPPPGYFKAHGLTYHVPEPAVFYYYTGLKTIWANSPEASKANWLVRAANGKLVMDSVYSKRGLEEALNVINQYPYSL